MLTLGLFLGFFLPSLLYTRYSLNGKKNVPTKHFRQKIQKFMFHIRMFLMGRKYGNIAIIIVDNLLKVIFNTYFKRHLMTELEFFFTEKL